MQPIIRRTITITITETWTITWQDGHETVWEEAHEVASPADSGPGDSLPLLTDDDEHENGVLDPDAADPTADE
jgi:hypothetical protein